MNLVKYCIIKEKKNRNKPHKKTRYLIYQNKISKIVNLYLHTFYYILLIYKFIAHNYKFFSLDNNLQKKKKFLNIFYKKKLLFLNFSFIFINNFKKILFYFFLPM